MTKQVGSVTVEYDPGTRFNLPFFGKLPFAFGGQSTVQQWTEGYAKLLGEKLVECVDDTLTTSPKPLRLSVELNGEKLTVTVSGARLDMRKVRKLIWDKLDGLFANGRVADTIEAIYGEPKQNNIQYKYSAYDFPPHHQEFLLDTPSYSPHRPLSDPDEPQRYIAPKDKIPSLLETDLGERIYERPLEKDYIIPPRSDADKYNELPPQKLQLPTASGQGKFLNNFPEPEDHSGNPLRERTLFMQGELKGGDAPAQKDNPTLRSAVSASADIVVPD